MEALQSVEAVPAIVALALVVFLLFGHVRRLFASISPRPATKKANPKNIDDVLLPAPPGPTEVPVLGNLGILFTSNNLPRDLMTLADKNGPVMRLQLGSRMAVVVSSAETAHTVLREKGMAFASRPFTYSASVLSMDNRDIAIAPHSAFYVQQRRTFVTGLMDPKIAPAAEPDRNAELDVMIQALREHVLKPGRHAGAKPEPVYLNLLFRTLTYNNILRLSTNRTLVTYHNMVTGGVVVKGEEESESDRFSRMMEDFKVYFDWPMLGDWVPWLSFVDELLGSKAKVRDVRRRFEAFIDQILADLMKNKSSGGGDRSFLEEMVQRQTPVSTIKGMMLDLLVGGTEPVTTTLEWTFAELLRRPDVYRKAQEEVVSAVGKDRQASESDLPNLPYIDGVVKETLRMYPATPMLIPHLSTEATEVAGYHVPADTIVLVNALALGRDPAVWPQPDEFQPERWVKNGPASGTSVQGLSAGAALHLAPFGAGRRACPGSDLALRLMSLTVARMLQNFNWSVPDGEEAPDLVEKTAISLARRNPVRAVPTLLV